MPGSRSLGVAAVFAFLLCTLLAGPASAQVVISQLHGGGGASGATYTHDFVELFNAGDDPVDLSGKQIAYASAAGTTWNNRFLLPATTLPPGGYFLVQLASGGSNGVALPAPDAITGSINMSAANGKVALVDGVDQLPTDACPAGAHILDLVGYGTANCPSSPVPALSNAMGALRNDAGCANTGVNSADFSLATPAARNTATTANPCTPVGSDIEAAIADASMEEGNSGFSDLVFTVTLSEAAPAGGIAFTASTTDGTAEAPADYTSLVDAPFTVAEGETTGTVTVQIVGDTAIEDDETFTVTIATEADGVVITQATATGTIVNDDHPVVIPTELHISQVYGGGGNSGAPFTHDFVELFNAGAAPVSLAGLTLRYASAAGSFTNSGNNYLELPAHTIAAGGYYLVQMAGGANGSALPTADATGGATMAAANGKVVLVASTGDFACGHLDTPCSPEQLALIVDFVGFGTATWFEGSGPTGAPSNTTAVLRNNNGCTDTDDNAADFTVAAPAPRNSAWPAYDCKGGNDDVIVFIAAASIAESDEGLTDLAFTVTLSAPAPAGGVAITATTTDGTAQAPGDYLALTDAPFTIAEGESTGAVIVQIVGDTEVEEDETFTVTIASSQAGVVIGNGTATGTIVNDDVPGNAPVGLVISQVYGGGGNSGAPYTHDFVELFNAGSAAVELAGLQIAYTSAAGNSWNNRTVLPAATLQPGQYFLVQQGAGAGNGVALPTADAIGEIAMGAANGKIALIFGTAQIPNDVCPTGENILDLVGWGTANCPVSPASPVGALSNTTAALRNGNGCDNSGNNADDFSIDAPAPRNSQDAFAPCAGSGKPDLVISQVYGGGGNSGATLTHDFVELFNAGSAPATLDGLTLRYGNATGNFPNSGDNYFPLPAVSVPAGGYYLVQMAQGAGGTQPLPTPDAIGAAAMAAASGKIVLVAGTGDFACGATATPCSPEQLALVVDLVGFGTANLYEGTGATGVLSNTTAALRNENGCVDTDDNAADFTVGTPAPRNSAAPANLCGGVGPDPDPVLSIANASVAEGDSGLTDMVFNVTLSLPAPAGGVAFTASTADGTAQAPGDYLALVDAPFTIAEGESVATVTVQIVGDTEQEPDETFTVTIATSTPDIVLGNATATGTIVNDDLDTLEIFQIQGAGLRSPYAPATGNDLGQQVRTDGNVVTAISSNGFFMQTPDARDDNDPATSNGIFVFTGSAPSVLVGNTVDVLGRVQEYFDWTQLTSATVTVTGTAELPTPVVLDQTTPSADPLALTCPLTDSNFECLENMLVHVPAGAVVQGNQRYASDLFGEAFVTASGERARREKGLLPNAVPPVAGLPVWDGNPEVFELDADGAGAVPTGTPLFGGDLFEATGVIAYQFGNYALRASTLTLVEADMPRPVPASSGDAELRVGSFNTLNLCQGGCNPTKLARIADYIGNVLDAPDVIGLQEVVGVGSATALANAINTTFGTDYVGYIGSTPFSDGIRNAFLVRPSRVEVIRVRELDATVMIDQCSGTPPCVLHDRPPHLLDARFIGGDGERFSVLNNHTRSLIGIGDAGAAGERVRYKRFEQGKSLATLVQRFQNGEELQPADPIGDIATADVPLLLVGDYNAFEVTDGYVDVVGLIAGSYDNAENQYQLDGGNIVDPPLRVLVNDVPVDDRYSYTFREDLGNTLGEAPRNVGSVQVLDHGFANAAAMPWCSGLVYGRGNADAPAELRNTGTDAVASSDHDGFIIRLSTDRLFRHDFEAQDSCRP